MKIPKKLKYGDTIGILSTARKITKEEINPAIHLFESWGLKVCLGDFLFEEFNQFSGTIQQRTSDLQKMINCDTIKAIVFSRGGYGTVQIIDNLFFDQLKFYPKWFLGYSDITVLHSHLNKFGLASVHSTMPINFHNNTKNSIKSLQNVLFEKENLIKTKPYFLNREGQVTGEIVGGNLSIIYSLLGSKSDICTKGKILLIEDLDEYLYHIDRMMYNLSRNGKFKNLKGVIVGSMSDMKDNEIPFGQTAYEIIHTHLKKYSFPVCYNFPIGHLKNNHAVKLGVKSYLDINSKMVTLIQN